MFGCCLPYNHPVDLSRALYILEALSACWLLITRRQLDEINNNHMNDEADAYMAL